MGVVVGVVCGGVKWVGDGWRCVWVSGVVWVSGGVVDGVWGGGVGGSEELCVLWCCVPVAGLRCSWTCL